MLPAIGRDVRTVKWRLWHGRVGRAIRDLEQLPRADPVAACCIASLRSHNIEDVRPSLLSYRLAWLDQPAPRRRVLRLCGIACTRLDTGSLGSLERCKRARYSVPGSVSIIHGRSSSIISAGEHRTRDISAPRRLAKAWSTAPKPNHTSAIRPLKCDRDHQPISIGLSGSPWMQSGGRSWPAAPQCS